MLNESSHSKLSGLSLTVEAETIVSLTLKGLPFFFEKQTHEGVIGIISYYSFVLLIENRTQIKKRNNRFAFAQFLLSKGTMRSTATTETKKKVSLKKVFFKSIW